MLSADWRVIVRRWYLVLAGLLLTVGLGVLGGTLVPATYELSASVLLLPPRTVVDGKVTNPYTTLDGLDGVADVLSTAMADDTVAEGLPDSGRDVTFELERDVSVAGPVLLLTVDAPTPGAAEASIAHLLGVTPVRLSELQGAVGVALKDRVTSTVITRDIKVEVVRKSQIRAVLASLVGGLTATYLFVAALDSALLRRRRPQVAGSHSSVDVLPSAPPQPRTDSARSHGRGADR